MTSEEFLAACKLKNDKGFSDVETFIKNKGKFKIIKDPKGASPLHLAVRERNIKIVQLLIDNGMNPLIKDKTQLEKTPVADAIIKGYVDVVMILLNSRFIKPLKTKKRFNEFSALGNSSLSLDDYKTILQKLLDVGLDAEELDNKDETILLKAIKDNDIGRLNVCLDLGLDINNSNRLPLKFALFKKPGDNAGNNDIIKFLLSKNAKIVIKSEDSWSTFNALHTAHIRDNIEIFAFLIEEFNALDTLDDETLDDIINHKEIEFLKYLWKIPRVHDFILKNNLEKAFPDIVRNVFIF